MQPTEPDPKPEPRRIPLFDQAPPIAIPRPKSFEERRSAFGLSTFSLSLLVFGSFCLFNRSETTGITCWILGLIVLVSTLIFHFSQDWLATCPLCHQAGSLPKAGPNQIWTCPTCKLESSVDWTGPDPTLTPTTSALSKVSTIGTVSQALPPGSGCGFASVGCSAFCVLIIVAVSMFFESAPQNYLPAPAPAPVAQPAPVSVSTAHKLAQINAGTLDVSPGHPTVQEFQSILDRLKVQYQDGKTEDHYADVLVHTWNQVKVKEPDLTLLKFARMMVSIDPNRRE